MNKRQEKIIHVILVITTIVMAFFLNEKGHVSLHSTRYMRAF